MRERKTETEREKGEETGRKEERTTFIQAFKQNGRKDPGRGMEEHGV